MNREERRARLRQKGAERRASRIGKTVVLPELVGDSEPIECLQPYAEELEILFMNKKGQAEEQDDSQESTATRLLKAKQEHDRNHAHLPPHERPAFIPPASEDTDEEMSFTKQVSLMFIACTRDSLDLDPEIDLPHIMSLDPIVLFNDVAPTVMELCGYGEEDGQSDRIARFRDGGDGQPGTVMGVQDTAGDGSVSSPVVSA